MLFSNCLIFQYVLSFVLQKSDWHALCFQYVLSFVFSDILALTKNVKPVHFTAALPTAPWRRSPLSSPAECHVASLAQWRAVVKRKMGRPVPQLESVAAGLTRRGAAQNRLYTRLHHPQFVGSVLIWVVAPASSRHRSRQDGGVTPQLGHPQFVAPLDFL